jgi:hypothetical protein
LEALKKEGTLLGSQQDAAQEILDRMIQDLTMNVRL